jgi:hypothetical protein
VTLRLSFAVLVLASFVLGIADFAAFLGDLAARFHAGIVSEA